MTRRLLIAILLLVSGVSYGQVSAPLNPVIVPSSPPNGCLPGSTCPPGQWALIFDDEFDGSSIDTTKWLIYPDYYIDSGQYCFKNSTQLTVSGGVASIRGFDTAGTPCPLLSGGILSAGGGGLESASMPPGYYEARIKADPLGGGPAGMGGSGFWGLTAGGGDHCSGALPVFFEADIIEYWNGGGHSGVIYGDYTRCKTVIYGVDGEQAADQFHIWGMLYDPYNGITYYKDGVQVFSYNNGCSVSTPCVTRFWIEINNNLQAGATDTSHPMLIDWVRVYTPAGALSPLTSLY
jgi:hypothetical protein